MERQEGRETVSRPASRRTAEGEGLHPDAEWDAGDMGCGELVLELRLRLQPMQPGQLFKLTARDPGALEDLPAWCRLTGHRLVRAAHPVYWIGRREG
jgi:tRNA 2-thiouridine synthesizing protein A